MSDESLRSKTIRGLSWSFLETVGLQGVRFVIGIVLARLLLPEQFGLIGMLVIFMAVAQSFVDGGFGDALIQKLEATAADLSTIFYFNVAVGLMGASALCLCAPWIASFYGQPILTPLTRALSLTIVINSLGLVQSTILTKEINFKTQTKVSLIASTLSGIIGITLALTGFGVWSLVVLQVAGALFRTLLLWLLNDWRPMLVFSLESLRQMFGFGSRLLASGLLNQLFENLYLLVIGKLFSAADLGHFTRAKNFQELPSSTIAGMVGRVAFPVFSTIQDDVVRLKRGLKKAVTMLVLVNFPIMIGLAAIARPLVLTLLTEKWAPCIPYLQLFCVAGMLYPLHVINLNVLTALGRSELFLRLEIIKKTLVVVSIAVTWQWGIAAMICGIIGVSVISYYLNSYYTGVLVGYPFVEQLADLFPYFIVSALMGIAVYAVGMALFSADWSILVTQISIGVATYVCLCRAFRLAAFMEVWQAAWDRMPLVRA